MKAIQVQVPGGPESLIEVDLPDPLPGPGQVRVKACAIGVGRPDVLIRKGTYKWMPPLPAIPGAEMAGEIDAVGEGVQQWQPGDRVLVSARELAQRGGCYAQAIVVPQDAPYRLPAPLAFEDAVSLPNLQLALALMRVAGEVHGPNPHALITGASGGVAGMLCQVARLKGLRTIGTSRTADKSSFALEQGFDHVVCTSQDKLPERIAQITQGHGLSVVFDHLGGQSLIDGLRSLAPLGTLVSYNIIQGMPTEDVFQVMRDLLGKSLAVRCFSMHTFDEDVSLRRGLMHEAIELMASGQVKAPECQIFKLSKVQKTHELLDQGLVSGKLVMHP
jgi:NADPH2:quinone reductase